MFYLHFVGIEWCCIIKTQNHFSTCHGFLVKFEVRVTFWRASVRSGPFVFYSPFPLFMYFYFLNVYIDVSDNRMWSPGVLKANEWIWSAASKNRDERNGDQVSDTKLMVLLSVRAFLFLFLFLLIHWLSFQSKHFNIYIYIYMQHMRIILFAWKNLQVLLLF